MARKALLFVALLTGGIGTGGAFTAFFDFDPANTTPAFWTAHLQHAIPRIGVPLFVTLLLAAVSTIASAVLARRDRPSFWYLVAASVALVAFALVTGVVHIPINMQSLTWSLDALPADFADLQHRWWTFHIVRFATLVVGLSGVILGALTPAAAET